MEVLILIVLLLGIFYVGWQHKKLDQQVLREAKKKLLASLELARNNPKDAQKAVERLRDDLQKAEKRLSFFGTGREELNGLILWYHIEYVKLCLERVRENRGNTDYYIEQIRNHAWEAKKDLAFFGTSEEELKELRAKIQIMI